MQEFGVVPTTRLYFRIAASATASTAIAEAIINKCTHTAMRQMQQDSHTQANAMLQVLLQYCRPQLTRQFSLSATQLNCHAPTLNPGLQGSQLQQTNMYTMHQSQVFKLTNRVPGTLTLHIHQIWAPLRALEACMHCCKQPRSA